MNQLRDDENHLLKDEPLVRSEHPDHEPVDKKALRYQNLFSIVYNGIWAILFYMYSSDESKYGGQECINLKFWCLYFLIYCMGFIVTRIFVIIPLLFFDRKDYLRHWMQVLFKVTDVLETYVGLIFVIAFTVLLFQNEPCGDLRKLTIIFVSVVYFVVFTIICCCISSIIAQESDQRVSGRHRRRLSE